MLKFITKNTINQVIIIKSSSPIDCQKQKSLNKATFDGNNICGDDGI